ncbi:UDP-N-acetylglucosamine 4,6-dehydratase (inverting) [Simkania negevensis]|uniref:UDP-N-acetylglucosamine 4,6-dehydratase (Inverting) n=1 Tax=Simkania negevensis TaxID=83561 RepID=A0ABS3AUK8_9BACT|nr:UDP-N-acetylglucosamine 4,6-dehydratase (inverting) [Simkania negevensis]
MNLPISLLTEELRDKTVLVTGGTGSFGRSFIKLLLEQFSPAKVIIFSRDEWKQWDMRQTSPIYRNDNIRYFLGDVRDKERLYRAFKDVDIVIHAAALKQVPKAEYDPSEFIKTNIIGAMNVIDAAIDLGVQKVIALSTDKAVNPINLYGATKLSSDKLFVAANSYVGKMSKPIFSVVRYGNVLGSRGSIIPLWKQLVEEGTTALPITDLRMTRFWITLEQAVFVVLSSLTRMVGGEIFVPKVPSMKIVDLAEAIAPGMAHQITGIRAGEKLHELMICADDARNTYEFNDYYVICPHLTSDQKEDFLYEIIREGTLLSEGFSYASNTNSQWLGVEELKNILIPDLSKKERDSGLFAAV